MHVFNVQDSCIETVLQSFTPTNSKIVQVIFSILLLMEIKKHFICNSCLRYLKKGDIPPLSAANNMCIDECPTQLQDLSSLKTLFISRRIPFMKLLAIPRGKQNSIYGCVVNIPIEPEHCVSVLPRVASPEEVVLVKLKRKRQYRGHAFQQNIRPQKIHDALHLIKNSLQNPLYKDVIINDDWQQQNCQNDEELWTALTAPLNEETNDQCEEECEADECEDERSKLSGIPFDTCLQPKDLIQYRYGP